MYGRYTLEKWDNGKVVEDSTSCEEAAIYMYNMAVYDYPQYSWELIDNSTGEVVDYYLSDTMLDDMERTMA